MALQTKEKEIGGHKVAVTQFPGRAGLRMKTRLVRLIGPAIGALAGGVDTKSAKSIMEADLGGDAISKAVEALVGNLDEQQHERLVLDLLAMTRIDNREASRPEEFDEIFAGSFGKLYKILFFVIEVNYGSFFDGVDFGNLLRRSGSETKAAAPEDN